MNDSNQPKVSANRRLLDVAQQLNEAAEKQNAASSQLKDLADVMVESLNEEVSTPGSPTKSN